MENVFAGYPAPFIHDTPGGRKIQQLIWGDWVQRFDEEDGDWARVRARRESGWMRKTDLQRDQLLEVNFIDVGQGDGAFIVMPDGRFMLIDAGEADNMVRFLSWRFNLRQHSDRVITFPHAVITHPDQDHYRGFSGLFDSMQFRFGTVYHNGIVERAGDASLGSQEQRDGQWYLTEIIGDTETLRQLLDNPVNVGRRPYPRILRGALTDGRVGRIRAIDVSDRFLPGFGADRSVQIEVLGPAQERLDGKPALRRFGGKSDDGKTKNGHSVVLRLVYRNVRLLLGGDLNIPAEEYLLRHHTGRDPRSTDLAEREALIAAARTVFEADVAKACHHGSSDFSDLFLQTVNPLATVISSGDDEPHAHPRPDALGAVGKHGRGQRPLVFSTELARSTKDDRKDPSKLRDQLRLLIQARVEAETDEERESAQSALETTLAQLERSVAVYGLINLRTDGQKVLLAQKLERPRSATREEWDVHRLEKDHQGNLAYVSKH